MPNAVQPLIFAPTFIQINFNVIREVILPNLIFIISIIYIIHRWLYSIHLIALMASLHQLLYIFAQIAPQLKYHAKDLQISFHLVNKHSQHYNNIMFQLMSFIMITTVQHIPAISTYFMPLKFINTTKLHIHLTI